MLENYEDILIFDELVEILKVGKNTTYNLLKHKKIYSPKIGRGYKIPKLCVVDYLYNIETDKSNILKDYPDVLEVKEVISILREPCKKTLYKILKDKEIYSKMIAKEYKIPKSSLIEYIFKEKTINIEKVHLDMV